MIIVDSDILIQQLRGQLEADAWLRETRRRELVAISAVTLVEVVGGMRSSERRDVVTLISQMRILDVTTEVAWKAADFMRTYRRSHMGTGTNDYVIAATADIHGATLATLNIRHFPMFPELALPF